MMPIICMTTESEKNLNNVETIKNYPNNNGDIFMKTEYVGCVIKEWGKCGFDDSDYYALVWDTKTMTTKTVEYATTRFWTYPNSRKVDAIDEVLKYYECKKIL